MKQIRFVQQRTDVLMLVNGRLVAEMPYKAALEVSKACYQVAKKAEEIAQVDRLTLDGGILMRAGFPIGLTDNKDIQKEIAKEAVSNRDLRRFMPGGVKSREVFGTPSVIRHEPTKGGKDGA